MEISLKEYRKMQSIAYRPASDGNTLEKQPAQRPAKEMAKTYVVKKGDNLWNIAKRTRGWIEIWRTGKEKRHQQPFFDLPGTGH